MATLSHDWIENCGEFEAVFLCLNSLKSWDKHANARAFQTFGWNDASISADELTFAHITSGVMILFDGNILAVKFGNNQLTDALSDLFSVVNNLGWKLVEVYHPAHSMSVLMAEIGRAIPAHMDLDITPAKASLQISAFAEAASLVEYATSLQKGEGVDFDKLVLEEVESMSILGTDMGVNSPFVPTALKNVFPDHLEDHINDHDAQALAPQVNQNNVDRLGVESTEVDEYPLTNVLTHPDTFNASSELPSRIIKQEEPAIGVALSAAQRKADGDNQASLVIENENLRDELAFANDRLEVSNEQVRRLTEDLGHSKTRQFQSSEPVLLEEVSTAFLDGNVSETPLQPLKSVVRIGASVLCFDVPERPLSKADLSVIAVELVTPKIFHVWLGSTGGEVRWDVLGDISTRNPWTAQCLASTMGFTKKNAVLAARIFIELSKHITRPQLRDVLEICTTIRALANFQTTEDEENPVFTEIGTLLLGLSRVSLSSFLDEVEFHFDGLFLCPDGDTFVDVKGISKDTTSDSLTVLSLQELAESPVSRLFVIHVDALDGPFVLWLSNLLETMAGSYSRTTRYPLKVSDDAGEVRGIDGAQINFFDVPGPAQLAGEAESVKEQTLVEVGALLSSLSAQLRRLGVTF